MALYIFSLYLEYMSKNNHIRICCVVESVEFVGKRLINQRSKSFELTELSLCNGSGWSFRDGGACSNCQLHLI